MLSQSVSIKQVMSELWPAWRKVWMFGVVTHLLILVPSWYMLEVYERVINSRNTSTLLMLTLLAVFAYVVMEALEWQRRLHWSRAQAQLELSRDRLTLFSRVVFYILIGIMVTVLYIPIFTVASMFGVH